MATNKKDTEQFGVNSPSEKLRKMYMENRPELATKLKEIAKKNNANDEVLAQMDAFIAGTAKAPVSLGLAENYALTGLTNLIFNVYVMELDMNVVPETYDMFSKFETHDIDPGVGFVKRALASLSADVADMPNFQSTSATITELTVGKNVKNQTMYEAASLPSANTSGSVGKVFSITIPKEVGRLAFTDIQAFDTIMSMLHQSIIQTKEGWMRMWSVNFILNEYQPSNTITNVNNNIYLDATEPYISTDILDWTQNVFIPIVKRMMTPDNRFNIDGALNTTTNQWDFSAAIAAGNTCLTNNSATFANIQTSKIEDLYAFIPVGLDGKWEFGVMSNKFNYKFSELVPGIERMKIFPMNKYINFSANNIQANAMIVPTMGDKIIPDNTIILVDKKAFEFGKLWEMIESNFWANSFIETQKISIALEGIKLSWVNGVKFVDNAIATLPAPGVA